MREIVGVLIGSTIYTGMDALVMIKKTNNYDRLIDRDVANFMHCADLGEKWTALAQSPTLFYIDDKGIPSLGEKYESRTVN